MLTIGLVTQTIWITANDGENAIQMPFRTIFRGTLLILSWVVVFMSIFKDIKYVFWVAFPCFISTLSTLTYEKDVVSIDDPLERKQNLIYALFFSFQSIIQVYLMGELMGKYRVVQFMVCSVITMSLLFRQLFGSIGENLEMFIYAMIGFSSMIMLAKLLINLEQNLIF